MQGEIIYQNKNMTEKSKEKLSNWRAEDHRWKQLLAGLTTRNRGQKSRVNIQVVKWEQEAKYRKTHGDSKMKQNTRHKHLHLTQDTTIVLFQRFSSVSTFLCGLRALRRQTEGTGLGWQSRKSEQPSSRDNSHHWVTHTKVVVSKVQITFTCVVTQVTPLLQSETWHNH